MEFMTIDIFLTVVGCTSVITLLTQVFKQYLPEKIDVKWLALVFSLLVGIIRMCVVKDFSFELQKGSIHSIIGESGSGKTMSVMSIIKLLPKNAKITSGEILYNGVNLLNLSQ